MEMISLGFINVIVIYEAGYIDAPVCWPACAPGPSPEQTAKNIIRNPSKPHFSSVFKHVMARSLLRWKRTLLVTPSLICRFLSKYAMTV